MMLPNGKSGCVPSTYCKHRATCQRYTEPGRVAMDFSTDLDRSGDCEWKIVKLERTDDTD